MDTILFNIRYFQISIPASEKANNIPCFHLKAITQMVQNDLSEPFLDIQLRSCYLTEALPRHFDNLLEECFGALVRVLYIVYSDKIFRSFFRGDI